MSSLYRFTRFIRPRPRTVSRSHPHDIVGFRALEAGSAALVIDFETALGKFGDEPALELVCWWE
jgi:hypothetical protein